MTFESIRIINREALITISKLHKNCLYWTLNSALGEEQILRSYKGFLSQTDFHLLVAKNLEGEICSVISFTADYRSVNLPFQLLSKTIFLGLLKCPISLFKTALEQVQIRRSLPNEQFAFIYSWFTAFNSRNLGLGKSLMDACISELENRKVKNIYVDVSNQAPKSFEIYFRYGFTLHKELQTCKILKYTIKEMSDQ